jgi:glycosyltransferase involved in cell wall biosynthesis
MMPAANQARHDASAGQDVSLRKIAIVNTADTGGGVERRSMMLLDALQARGVETRLVVGDRRSGHPRVVWMHASPHVDYRPYQPRLRRMRTRARWRIDRLAGREDFEHPLTRHVLEMTGNGLPDLLLCQNLHGGYFDLRMLPLLSRRVPLVLSLNDSWLFSGHCACPLTCARWETGCGHCPDLEIPPAIRRDATAANWRRKQDIFAASRLWAIAPTRWMLDRCRRSLLGPALQDARVIEHGVDLETFFPGPRRPEVRRALGIGPGSNVLMFVSNLGAANPTKDFLTLRRALQRLVHTPPTPGGDRAARPIVLLVAGAEGPEERIGEHVLIRHLPHRGRQDLADLYRASDLYVHSAREESFSLTTAEALACGTPALAAAGGGIREVVEHGRTGVLIDPGDDAALAAELQALLEDPRRRAAMSLAAAEAARLRFDAERMVDETLDWCRAVAERWRVERPATPPES